MRKLPKPTQLIPMWMVVIAASSLSFLLFAIAFASILPSTDGFVAPAFQAQHEAIMDSLIATPFSYNAPEFFNAAEAAHMADVKLRFDLAFVAALLAIGILTGLFVALVIQKMRAQIEELAGRALRAAGYATVGISMFITFAAVLSFEKFWVLFHVFTFPGGGWLFPIDSILITIYPASFFASVATLFLLRATIAGAICILLGALTLRMAREEQSFRARGKR